LRAQGRRAPRMAGDVRRRRVRRRSARAPGQARPRHLPGRSRRPRRRARRLPGVRGFALRRRGRPGRRHASRRAARPRDGSRPLPRRPPGGRRVRRADAGGAGAAGAMTMTTTTTAARTYRAMMVTKAGGPEVLECVELPVEPPGPGQLRVRVRAAGVGSTDQLVLAGNYRFAPKIPLVPGYEIAGVVDAVGDGVTDFSVGQRVAALTVYGGFSELLVRGAEHFIPIPDGVSDADAAAVILNYVTAWQMIHRVAKVRAAETALVTGAAGGVGTAALQLLRLAGVKAYGAASAKKHDTVRKLGATPIDYRAGRIDRLTREHEPRGVDHVFDAVGGTNIGPCIGAARRGGTVVGYGFMGVEGTLATLAMFVTLLAGARLRGRRGAFYGITMLYRRDPQPLREDLPKVFALVADKKIDPLISATFPLLDGRRALELLATGTVEGKLVL